MSNLTLFSGNKVSLKKGASAVVAALKGAAAQGAGDDLPEGGVYISFSGKTGSYNIGTDKTDADPNEPWLMNVWSFESGWTCWKGGSPAAKRMASIFGEPIPTPDMDEHGPFNASRGEGWFKSKSFMLRSLDSGRQGLFATNSKSGVREFSKIEGEIARRMEESLPCWPVIYLDKAQFKAQGQTNWRPVLEVVGWLGIEQVNKMAAAGSAKEISEMLPKLLKQAAKMEADGIADTTLTGDEDAPEAEADDDQIDEVDGDDEIEVDDVADEGDDEIEDAEIVDEDEVEEEEPAPAPVRRRTAASSTTQVKPQGLRRR